MKKQVDGKLRQEQKTSQPVTEWIGPYLEFRQVSKIYQMGDVEIRALNKTSFTIERGELVVILGQSGAGKTTALNILGGMDRVTSGSFRMEGQEKISIKEKPVRTKEEALMYTAAMLYAGNGEFPYQVQITDEEVEKEVADMSNVVISRK